MSARVVHPVTSSSTPAAARACRAARRYPVGLCAVAIVALTALGALASTVIPELGPGRPPHPTLHASVGEALSILATNTRTLIAPLLLAAGRWHTGRATRAIGDAVVAAVLIINPVLVGLAVGRYPTQLPAYLPHLPLEDGALAIAASAWLTRRLPSSARPVPGIARTTLLTAAAATVAAFIETYAVPHQS